MSKQANLWRYKPIPTYSSSLPPSFETSLHKECRQELNQSSSVSQSVGQDDPHQDHWENLWNMQIRRPAQTHQMRTSGDEVWRSSLPQPFCESHSNHQASTFYGHYVCSGTNISNWHNFREFWEEGIVVPSCPENQLPSASSIAGSLSWCINSLQEDSALAFSTPASWGPSFCFLHTHPSYPPTSALFIPCPKHSRTLRSLILTNLSLSMTFNNNLFTSIGS